MTSRTTIFLAMAVAWLLATGSAAGDAPVIRVLALFPGKAMLSIGGANRLLEAGERAPEGVELVSANAREAQVRVDGQLLTLRPGGAVSANYQAPQSRELRVVRNNQGAYAAPGRINGGAVEFLIDTGASSVAMSEAEARRIGIPFELTGQRIGVATANGLVEAYRVVLDTVEVGDIRLRNVEGNVVLGSGPDRVLLGMSFLNRLDFENRGNLMLLRQKF